jgi:hypothetical protein
MPTAISVTYTDGSKEEFPHKERPGGSWTNSIRYEGGFAIIKDSWGNEVAIPQSSIMRIKVTKYQ